MYLFVEWVICMLRLGEGRESPRPGRAGPMQTGDLYFWPPGELECAGGLSERRRPASCLGRRQRGRARGGGAGSSGHAVAGGRCSTRGPRERERERERDLLGNNVHDGGVQGTFAMRAEMLQDASAFPQDLDEECLDAPRAKTPASV